MRVLLQQPPAAATAERDAHEGGGEAIRVEADDTATMAAVRGGCAAEAVATITVVVMGMICLIKRVTW